MALDWKFLVDWQGLGGLNIGSFEGGKLDGWVEGGVTGARPTLTPDDTRSYDGDWSMKVAWSTATPGFAAYNHSGFVPGQQYTLSAWQWHPSGDAPPTWGVDGIGFGSASLTADAWALLTFTFTATLASHSLQLWPAGGAAAGDLCWFDRIRILGPTGNDVTSRVLARNPVTVSYGRDQARSLNPVGPAQAALVLDNRSKDYSPENTSSTLNGYVSPNRDLLVEATWNGKAYTMFRGKTDGFDVLPSPEERAVSITALDALAALRGETISTDLHVGITTGDAVHAILDEVGWPSYARDIDKGATAIRFWWEERTDAGTALERILNSEGPPATAFVSSAGDFVFRDRHHRLTESASLTSQATFSDVAEPAFMSPLVYDHGWRDIINSVTFSVDERGPSSTAEVVWTSDTIYSIEDGETLILRAEFSDPVIGAITPVDGTDYRIRSGTVTVSLSRTTGASITLFVKATGGPAVVDQLQLRAYPVAVRATRQITAEDSASIEKYGRKSYPNDAPWANVHDAEAIAEVILAHRAERLPIVTFRMASGESLPTRLTQQLSRDLSDRITIVDPQTGLNDAFFIDRIEHTISQAGKYLETTFGCEKAPTTPGNLFRFNVAGRGFNDGAFGAIGLDDAATMFRFDTAGQGFDDGLFAH